MSKKDTVAADAAAPCTECGGSANIKCQSKHCPQAAQPDERAAEAQGEKWIDVYEALIAAGFNDPQARSLAARATAQQSERPSERSAFEAWAKDWWFFGDPDDPSAEDAAWEGWQAARATAPQATITKLAESNTDLRVQIERYQAICASAYQLAGAVDAPLRFLDALAAASNGEPVSEEAALDLLPVTVEECAVVPKGATLTDEQRGAVEWAIRKMDSPHIGSEAQRNCETLRTLLAAQVEK